MLAQRALAQPFLQSPLVLSLEGGGQHHKFRLT
jgi:hypothetical protein